MKPSTSGSSPTSVTAAVAMAAAIGCSLADSSAPASRSSCSRSTSAAGITSTSCIRPAVTVPVLSSTTVSTRRVCSSTSGPLMRMPSCAPRPVPTSRAVGVARPRAHGQAMIRTATAAVNASSGLAPVPSQKPSVATASAITTGTKTPDTRSASRCTSALPFCACSTSRAICASWVDSPTRVARTTIRPPEFTVAPTTASPGPTSTGTGSPVSIDTSTAEVPRTTSPSVATFSPGRTTNSSPTCSSPTGSRTSRPSRSTATSLAPIDSRARRAAAGTTPGARLQVAAEQQEQRHAGRDLEVDLVGARAAGRHQGERHRHAGLAGTAEEQRVQRPAEGGDDTERDERVHRGGAVPRADQRRAVERPGAPGDDRCGQGQRSPLPELELQRGDHRQQHDRDGECCGDDDALPQRLGDRVAVGFGAARRRRRVPTRRRRHRRV